MIRIFKDVEGGRCYSFKVVDIHDLNDNDFLKRIGKRFRYGVELYDDSRETLKGKPICIDYTEFCTIDFTYIFRDYSVNEEYFVKPKTQLHPIFFNNKLYICSNDINECVAWIQDKSNSMYVSAIPNEPVEEIFFFDLDSYALVRV